jgi:hypothetical protein
LGNTLREAKLDERLEKEAAPHPDSSFDVLNNESNDAVSMCQRVAETDISNVSAEPNQ